MNDETKKTLVDIYLYHLPGCDILYCHSGSVSNAEVLHSITQMTGLPMLLLQHKFFTVAHVKVSGRTPGH
jgi:hypothetical protein